MFEGLGNPGVPSVGWRTNMDPVYSFVKAGSTRYCDPFLGQTQDVRFGGKFLRMTYFAEKRGRPPFPGRAGKGSCPLFPYRPASSVARVSAFVARLWAKT